MENNIDRIIANCRRDSRTVSGSERRALCDEIENLRDMMKTMRVELCKMIIAAREER